MVADVRAGLVKRVIIKDMSRFGRDYLQVGMYTEMIFPEYEVHFVAVNDGVDSQKGENDLTPFRNLFNEWYARDCSKKQRAVKRMKGMSGQRISSNPPYGYIKGEGGQLVPDPEAAWVVKLMFDLAAQGLGPVRIANILTKKKIPTPGTLAFRRTGKKRNYHPEAPYNWSDSTIANILEYKEYLGHTVNFKTYSKSYKFKKRLPTPEDQQMIFENTHPALVEQEVWSRFSDCGRGGHVLPSRGKWHCSLVCCSVQTAVPHSALTVDRISVKIRSAIAVGNTVTGQIAVPCTTSEQWFWKIWYWKT